MKPTSDPIRLLDPRGGASGPARTLLEGGKRDLPDVAQLARLAARLPLGAPSPGGGGSPVPVTPTPPPVALPLAASSFSMAFLGPALGLAVALAAIAAALLYNPSPASPSASPLIAAAPAPAITTETLSPVPSETPAPSSNVTMGAPPVGSPVAHLAKTGGAPVPTVTPAPSPTGAASVGGPEGLGREVDLLQRAQAALAGDPARALTIVGEHQARFPGGALVQEREVIAIGALVGLGRASEARARAARFVAQFPRSAFRRRIEALVPGLGEPPAAAP